MLITKCRYPSKEVALMSSPDNSIICLQRNEGEVDWERFDPHILDHAPFPSHALGKRI